MGLHCASGMDAAAAASVPVLQPIDKSKELTEGVIGTSLAAVVYASYAVTRSEVRWDRADAQDVLCHPEIWLASRIVDHRARLYTPARQGSRHWGGKGLLREGVLWPRDGSNEHL